MNREEIIEILHRLEEIYEVDKWNINGIDLWPVIRISYAFKLLSQNETCYINNKYNEQSKNPSLITKTIRYFYYGVRNKLHRIALYIEDIWARRYYRMTISNFDTKYIFLGAHSHRVMLNGTVYNRFFDPLIEQSKLNNYLVFEYDGYNTKNRYPAKEKVVDLNKVIKGHNLERNLITELNRWEQLLDFTKDQVVDNGYSEVANEFVSYIKSPNTVRILNLLLSQYLFWNKYFDTHKVKVVYTLCYYSIPNFAIYAAAKAHNIKTIEVQHGPQSKYHPAFAAYSKVPPMGYNTLPDVFWCWDQESTIVIKDWNSSRHQAIVGGHPWLEAWRLGLFKFKLETNCKPIILYALQTFPLEDAFPGFLIRTIKETEDMHWIIRLHPRMNNISLDIKELLEVNKISNFDIHKSDLYPLPAVLSKTAVNVTFFSGVTIEAAHMGIKTIVIDERGISFFTNLINQGDVIPFLSNDHIEFANLIRSVISENCQDTTGYIHPCMSIKTFMEINE